MGRDLRKNDKAGQKQLRFHCPLHKLADLADRLQAGTPKVKNLVFLRHRAYFLQQGLIIIFSFVRPLGQFDFLVMNLLVGNEAQDV